MKPIKLYEEYNKSMSSEDLDTIFYGNCTAEDQILAYKYKDKIRDWFIEQGYDKEFVKKAPKNSSDITKRDLEVMTSMMDAVTTEDMTFARIVDDVSNMAQIFLDYFGSKGIEETMGEFFRIDSQTESLLYYLKDKINRPRPYQLARAMGIEMYPLIKTDAMSAAYPSGHALTAYTMSEYYARKYPMYRGDLIMIGERIADSRVKMGLHFPSDSEISQRICSIIWKNSLIDM
jgi:hypothetical protein